MVKCTFCGNQIEKGTGKIFVFKDGHTYDFCSSKCERNSLKLKRKPLNTRWTARAQEGKKPKKGDSQ